MNWVGAWMLSGDLPRSKFASLTLTLILIALLLAPFVFPGTKSLSIAAKICYYIVLATSYDLLLGYTGIVSFAHAMFFGIGAYATALVLARLEPSFPVLALGVSIGLIFSTVLAAVIGALSFRLKTIFFAMITLAFAAALANTTTQLHWLTGGEDGLSYRLPELLSYSHKFFENKVFGVVINGKLLLYYVVFFVSLMLFLLMLRIVNSPFGTVLKAIRENEFRAAAIGYSPVFYRTMASVMSALVATIAGCLAALWLRYTGPDTTFNLDITIDILLMVVIGGLGTLYGPVIGATLVVVAQGYLQELLSLLGDLIGIPWIADNLLNPDRWLLWLGSLFILSVYFFPTGIVGYLRGRKNLSDLNIDKIDSNSPIFR